MNDTTDLVPSLTSRVLFGQRNVQPKAVKRSESKREAGFLREKNFEVKCANKPHGSVTLLHTFDYVVKQYLYRIFAEPESDFIKPALSTNVSGSGHHMRIGAMRCHR